MAAAGGNADLSSIAGGPEQHLNGANNFHNTSPGAKFPHATPHTPCRPRTPHPVPAADHPLKRNVVIKEVVDNTGDEPGKIARLLLLVIAERKRGDAAASQGRTHRSLVVCRACVRSLARALRSALGFYARNTSFAIGALTTRF